jgi:hypothetical protein
MMEQSHSEQESSAVTCGQCGGAVLPDALGHAVGESLRRTATSNEALHF